MEWAIIIGYLGAMLVICVFSFHQLNLALKYRRKKTDAPVPELTTFPRVTVQLPIYNEKYVVERLIDTVCNFDYPKDRFEIQVLDDSTDETTDLIKEKVSFWSKSGVAIHHVQRANRTGYKAGALQYGLQQASGEFIAIFDADFLPQPDFLKNVVPHFSENIGMVQTRWGHLNQSYSLLTRMQAFGLNAHFTVEQKGRESSGNFMNFNGTAGIWRKSCIEEAGGWQADTLTEDLDLSYRAQLNGWNFKYLENITTPAELPVLVPAIKSQQYRWNKGAAETARKHFFNILRSKLTPTVKLHALFHLLNSSVFLFLFIAAMLSVPMLFIKESQPSFSLLFNLASVFLLGFIAIAIFYWVASLASYPDRPLRTYLTELPAFLAFSMGMSLHNTVAVLEGFLGIKTPFIRTPKYNIISKTDSWKGNQYSAIRLSPIMLVELALAIYFLFGVVSGFWLGDYGLILFHVMLTGGFGAVAILSLKSLNHASA